MRLAVVNVADTGPLESTTLMLERAGWAVARPGPDLLRALRAAGLDHVQDPADLTRDWGYPVPLVDRLAFVKDMDAVDLFVDSKGHANAGRIAAAFPRLRDRVLWLCINGGDPNQRTDGLPWSDPPCPVLSHNQWHEGRPRQYTCFPPHARLTVRTPDAGKGPPVCLVHNVGRWGYGSLVAPLRALGVRFHGGGDGTDSLLPHVEALAALSRARCMVHLKAGDAMPFAVIEAIACGTPVVCTRRWIADCRLGRLMVPGVTCLALDPEDAVDSARECISAMADPDHRWLIADNARRAWARLEWDDPAGFAAFLDDNFPQRTNDVAAE